MRQRQAKDKSGSAVISNSNPQPSQFDSMRLGYLLQEKKRDKVKLENRKYSHPHRTLTRTRPQFRGCFPNSLF